MCHIIVYRQPDQIRFSGHFLSSNREHNDDNNNSKGSSRKAHDNRGSIEVAGDICMYIGVCDS